MNNKVCECGHELLYHNYVFTKNPNHPNGEWQGDGNCFNWDKKGYCVCKKFKPKNHSQKGKAIRNEKDTPKLSDKPEEMPDVQEKSSGTSLSDRIWTIQQLEKIEWKKRIKVLFVWDVKEAIKKLKEEFKDNQIQYKQDKYKSKRVQLHLSTINKIIDKIFGEELV